MGVSKGMTPRVVDFGGQVGATLAHAAAPLLQAAAAPFRARCGGRLRSGGAK